MDDLLAGSGEGEATDPSYILELARCADNALHTGNYNRCLAIVENIYSLLDRQSRFSAARNAGAVYWNEVE